MGKLAETFKGQVFALHRDDDAIAGGHEAVDGEQAQRGRAIDQNVVVAVNNGFDGLTQARFTLGQVDEFHFGAGQRWGCRQQADLKFGVVKDVR
ncbi:hypothetical protein SDC9_199062 [bioreactor metagenome]|uniref:Uncharacterized protein n=1 Tax=bioreactor metagenome TaxID=1076179 RepID=A0A645IJG0_9ZZZZ